MSTPPSSSSSPSKNSDIPTDPSRPPETPSKRKYQFLRLLTGVQNTSALVFSVFLGVHLVAPIAATIGGGELADKSMMIARAYYLPSERLTIYLPLLIHISTSLLRRLTLIFTSSNPRKTLSHIFGSPHLIAGYLAIPFLIPHILVHRYLPSLPPPLGGTSTEGGGIPQGGIWPSEFGFGFVGYSIFSRPLLSSVGYLGLTSLVTYHSAVGSMKIVSWTVRLRKRSSKTRESIVSTPQPDLGLGDHSSAVEPVPTQKISKRRKLGLRGIIALFTAFVGVGLVRLYGEGRDTRGYMRGRYEDVYSLFSLKRVW